MKLYPAFEMFKISKCLWLLIYALMFFGYTKAISVNCPTKRYVVILFQPVTLTCNYQTSSTQPPVVTWRYKSYCRDPIQAALNPSSAENALAQANPNYNPNIECADSQRTVRIVASKQGNAVTLGEVYQGRKISILNNADLNIAQTAWGDSGVYVCSVVSSQDLTGNSEDYTELIVLARSGYRIQATPDGNPTRVLYYMEQELANLDPSRPGVSSGNHNRRKGPAVQPT
ncbi:hypothetical protein ANANG_G00002460 [Anguilla anguilla]|uniref:Ig-like domain-containing protein n=1 Tax=Anguilla anguilla TaxID=7936 RepID=A0A9D3MZI2_ANGAN|nr:hypothetical protein ANANG_G00002460 [Anguilla anguilla]